MKNVKVCELRGVALDWAVAKLEGNFLTLFDEHFRRLCSDSGWSPVHADQLLFNQPLKGKWCVLVGNGFGQAIPNYHTDWAQAGPIIAREGIETTRCNDLYFPKGNEKGDYYEQYWQAVIYLRECDVMVEKQYGHTPLIAAMRCLVASKLGDCVEIPEKLNE